VVRCRVRAVVHEVLLGDSSFVVLYLEGDDVLVVLLVDRLVVLE
jgi:hypothetical protein